MVSMSERRARVSRSIDRVASERTRVVPMTNGGGYLAGVPDPERAPYEAEGVPSRTSGLAKRSGAGGSNAENIEVRAISYRVSYAKDAFGTNAPPRKGDRIELLEQEGAPTLQVVSFEPPEAAHGRLIVHLGKV